MASRKVNDYINKRYDRWLDYAKYHCEQAAMRDEYADVLNEVLYMLLQKNDAYLDQLYDAERGTNRELDYYVLKMIRLNIQSPTSPYQHAYKRIPVDRERDINSVDIEDEYCEDEMNHSNVEMLVYVIKSLNLSDLERGIIQHKVVERKKLSDWGGREKKHLIYKTYNQTLAQIKRGFMKKRMCG